MPVHPTNLCDYSSTNCQFGCSSRPSLTCYRYMCVNITEAEVIWCSAGSGRGLKGTCISHRLSIVGSSVLR